MKTKRIIATAIALMMLCVIPTINTFSYNNTTLVGKAADEIDSGLCGVNLNWSIDSEGTLIISGFGEMQTEPWKEKYQKKIKKVVIEDGATNLTYGAFSECSNLCSATVADTVESIGSFAFFNCSKLKSVKLPNNLKLLEESTFHGSGIESIEIPKSVKEIGQNAFTLCSELTSVSIPDGVEIIGRYSFRNCKKLESVELPNSVITLKQNAFVGCESLKTIKFSDNMTAIEEGTFADCKGIEFITIPENIQSIGKSAFSSCSSLKEITIINPECVITAGTSTISAGSGYYLGIIRGNEGSTAQEYAKSCNYIFALPDEVTTVDTSVVSEDTIDSGLCGVNLKWEIDSEGTLAISGSGEMQTEPWRRDYQKKLTKLIIEDGATSITYGAFSSCTNLCSATIADTVQSIGPKAFSGCEKLKTIRLPSNLEVIEDSILYNTGIESIEIPQSVKEIGQSAFGLCADLTSVSIPDGVEKIGGYAFRDCNKLESVEMPNSVTIIQRDAFLNCESLKSINLSDNLNTIKEEAFYNCTSIEKITIPESTQLIEKYSFGKCTNLNEITILNPECKFTAGAAIIFNEKSYLGILRGYTGSTAEQYAKTYNCIFDSIGEITTTTSSTTTDATTTTTTTTTAATSTNATTTSSQTTTTTSAVTQPTTTLSTLQSTTTITTTLPTTTTLIELSVKEKNVSLTNGEQYTIVPNRNDVTFESNNKSVAVVSSKGIITAIGEGTAIISVISSDYDVVQISVTVNPVQLSTTPTTNQTTLTTTNTTTASETSTEPITTTVPVIVIELGDLNSDNKVDAKDASSILVAYSKVSTGSEDGLTEEQRQAADINSDNMIDAKDASLILSYYAYISTHDAICLTEFLNGSWQSTTTTVSTTTTSETTTTTTIATTTTPINGVIYDENNIVVKYKGLSESFLGTEINLYIENNSDRDICLQTRDFSINGFMLLAGFSPDIATGKKINKPISILASDLEENDINEIEEIEFKLRIIDWSDNDYRIESETILIKVK